MGNVRQATRFHTENPSDWEPESQRLGDMMPELRNSIAKPDARRHGLAPMS